MNITFTMRIILGVAALSLLGIVPGMTAGRHLPPGTTAGRRLLPGGGEKKISAKQIPAAVKKAFEAAYPGAKITGQSVETEKGKKFFEIESLDGTVRRDLLYTADGHAAEIEETVDVAALPEGMRKTIAATYPDAKITRAEKVTRDSSTTYEIHIKSGKRSQEVVFDAEGKIVQKGDKAGEKEDDEEEDD